MKRAVITGATGAIGTALTEILIKNDVEVLIFTRRSSGRNDRIPVSPKIKIVYSDLADLSQVPVLQEGAYDVFYHFAWAGASGAGRNDMFLQTDNIRYSLDAVKLAKRLGCRTFIGAGSQAEYGMSDKKLTAHTPVNPVTGYGYAKLCAGSMTGDLAHQVGMEHIWVRILSVYGPNDGENAMIPWLIRSLAAGISPKMTACTQMWDYLYSCDAASALYLLGDRGADGRTYVLGGGRARPLREYVETVRDLVAPDIPVRYGQAAFSANPVMYLCADIADIHRDTGWLPETDFSDGIRKTSEWIMRGTE